MAPVAGSKKKGLLPTLAEKGERAMSRLLGHRTGVTKRKGRRGVRGLCKVISKGVNVALDAYDVARRTGVIDGVQGVVANAFVKAAGALIGTQRTQHMSSVITAGWNIEYEALHECDISSLSVIVSKTPEASEGREFRTRLQFRSPSDDFIRDARDVGVAGQREGAALHTYRRTPSRSGPSFPSTASTMSAAIPRLPPQPSPPPPSTRRNAHTPTVVPKREPRTPTAFETITLSPPRAKQLPVPRIKTERIKQEVPYFD